MPFALVLIGLVLVITSAQDSYIALGRQIRKDFTGAGSFIWWLGALVLVGALGYIEKLRPVATAFMSVILLVLVLKNKGAFTGLVSALKAGPSSPVKGPAEPVAQNIPGNSTGVSQASQTQGATPDTIFGGLNSVFGVIQ